MDKYIIKYCMDICYLKVKTTTGRSNINCLNVALKQIKKEIIILLFPKSGVDLMVGLGRRSF